jgi:hypothetical protein
MKERIRSRARSRSLISFTLVSAAGDATVSSTSRVIRARKQIRRRFLQCFICKVMVFPATARIEDQEVNNFNRMVLM